MKYALACLVLVVYGVALAQTSPKVATIKFKPVLELVNTVNLLAQMDAKIETTFAKAQAAPLLEVLKPLRTDANLEPDEAQKALTAIEQSILSPLQRKTLDAKRAEQRKLYERRRTQMTRVAEGGPNPLGVYTLSVPGGPLIIQALQKGEAFNPFRTGPNAEMLQKFIAALEQR
jgi:Skp family chaperone for outer membrane proteins